MLKWVFDEEDSNGDGDDDGDADADADAHADDNDDDDLLSNFVCDEIVCNPDFVKLAAEVCFDARTHIQGLSSCYLWYNSDVSHVHESCYDAVYGNDDGCDDVYDDGDDGEDVEDGDGDDVGVGASGSSSFGQGFCFGHG